MMGSQLFKASSVGRAAAALAGAALLATASSSAVAAMKIRLTSGATSIVVTDGGAGDLSAAAGVITFSGALGATVWGVNVTTGVSKPVIGGPSSAHIDLNSVNVTSGGAGTIVLELTDTDFSLGGAGTGSTLVGAIGGTTGGTVSATGCLNSNNGEFDCTGGTPDAIPGLGAFGPGAFSATSGTAFVIPAGPFSLSSAVTISHGGTGVISSFDFELRTAPEPGMVAVAGLGLAAAGLAGLRRRRRQSAA